jgi:PAS domain S-box-containing protein
MSTDCNPDDPSILEDIYLKTVEVLPDAVVIVNEKGIIVVFNKEAELFFGYHRSEIIGESVEVLIPSDLNDSHIKDRTKYMEQPRIRSMGAGRVLNGLHRSGRLIPIEIMLAPMPIAKAGTHVVAVVRLATINNEGKINKNND